MVKVGLLPKYVALLGKWVTWTAIGLQFNELPAHDR